MADGDIRIALKQLIRCLKESKYNHCDIHVFPNAIAGKDYTVFSVCTKIDGRIESIWSVEKHSFNDGRLDGSSVLIEAIGGVLAAFDIWPIVEDDIKKTHCNRCRTWMDERFIMRGGLCSKCFHDAFKPIEKVFEKKNGRSRSSFVYLIASPIGLCKIGIAYNPSGRLAGLQTGSPDKLELIFHAHVGDGEYHEKVLHETFKEKREHGEWFALTGEDIETAKAYLCQHQKKK